LTTTRPSTTSTHFVIHKKPTLETEAQQAQFFINFSLLSLLNCFQTLDQIEPAIFSISKCDENMAYRCNQELILKYGAPGHQQIHTWEGKPRNFLYFTNFQNKKKMSPTNFL